MHADMNTPGRLPENDAGRLLTLEEQSAATTDICRRVRAYLEDALPAELGGDVPLMIVASQVLFKAGDVFYRKEIARYSPKAKVVAQLQLNESGQGADVKLLLSRSGGHHCEMSVLFAVRDALFKDYDNIKLGVRPEWEALLRSVQDRMTELSAELSVPVMAAYAVSLPLISDVVDKAYKAWGEPITYRADMAALMLTHKGDQKDWTKKLTTLQKRYPNMAVRSSSVGTDRERMAGTVEEYLQAKDEATEQGRAALQTAQWWQNGKRVGKGGPDVN